LEEDLDIYQELPQGILIHEGNYDKECDCGGLKTYNSTNPMFHAPYCNLARKE
jgi:hypothetical protein